MSYLRHGHDELHGMAAGPMAEVSRNLAQIGEQDVRAISAYIASIGRSPASEPRPNDDVSRTDHAGEPMRRTGDGLFETGDTLFAGACSTCHGNGTEKGRGIVQLSLSTAISSPDPRNLIHIVLEGIHPPDGDPGLTMPRFADVLNDRQIAAIATYLRTRFPGESAWLKVEDDVRKIRRQIAPPSVRVTGADPSRAPALLRHYGCTACHTIPGVAGASGVVGPPLTGIGAQVYIAGTLANTPTNLIRWISDPRHVKPNTAMPNTGIAEQEARDVAAFLYSR